ncbi:MAG: hypothetical protein ACKO2P_06795 [Planctomycetota bacterium]
MDVNPRVTVRTRGARTASGTHLGCTCPIDIGRTPQSVLGGSIPPRDVNGKAELKYPGVPVFAPFRRPTAMLSIWNCRPWMRGWAIAGTPGSPANRSFRGGGLKLNAFKIATLWSMQTTSPYFHNDGAEGLKELLNHYQQDFRLVLNVVGIPEFGMTDQDKADIRACPEHP